VVADGAGPPRRKGQTFVPWTCIAADNGRSTSGSRAPREFGDERAAGHGSNSAWGLKPMKNDEAQGAVLQGGREAGPRPQPAYLRRQDRDLNHGDSESCLTRILEGGADVRRGVQSEDLCTCRRPNYSPQRRLPAIPLGSACAERDNRPLRDDLRHLCEHPRVVPRGARYKNTVEALDQVQDGGP